MNEKVFGLDVVLKHSVQEYGCHSIYGLMEVLTMVLMSDRVDENSTLKSLVAKHLESRADNLHMITELRHFCRREITELKLYFQKEPCEVSINSHLVVF